MRLLCDDSNFNNNEHYIRRLCTILYARSLRNGCYSGGHARALIFFFLKAQTVRWPRVVTLYGKIL